MKTIGMALWLGVLLAGCVNLKLQSRAWDPPPYYALERYAQIENLKICYLECGDQNRQAIVFIHGLSGNAENWWDQFEAFRDDYHVIIPDLPGHGKSSKPFDFEYSVPSFAKVVVELLDQLNIPEAVVVGNSLGGAIAGYIAIHYPERVSRLVLSDSAGLGINPLLKAATPLVSPALVRLTGVTSARQYPGPSPKDRARADFSASYRGTREEYFYLSAIDKALKQVAKFDFEPDLGKIQAKTLVIWGTDDLTVPAQKARVFDEKIPDSELYWVKDGGHTPNMLLPGEFNCALKNFMADQELEPCHELGEAERKRLEKEKAKR
jgi:pimeloyl-ACP methyl ester carboxylesterase